MKSSKELREKAKIPKRNPVYGGYHLFSPKEMQEYDNQICKEQRENCANEFWDGHFEDEQQDSVVQSRYKTILNAPKP